MVDMALPPPQRAVGGAFACMITYACVFITVGMLFMFLMCFVVYSPLSVAWWRGGYWWLFIFVPMAFILATIAGVCYVRSDEQQNTKKRLISLQMALEETQRRFLGGTGIELAAGDYGSWIEVNYYNYQGSTQPQIQQPQPNYDDYQSRPQPNPVYQEQTIYSKNNNNMSQFDDGANTNNPYSNNLGSPGRSMNNFQPNGPYQNNMGSPGRQMNNYQPDLFDFERGGPQPNRRNSNFNNNNFNNPDNQFMNGIRQEREQVMLDIDRRNHRRENFNASPLQSEQLKLEGNHLGNRRFDDDNMMMRSAPNAPNGQSSPRRSSPNRTYNGAFFPYVGDDF